MTYRVVRFIQGEPKPKVLKWKFPNPGEAEKMKDFLNSKVRNSYFKVVWFEPEKQPENRLRA